MEGHPIVAALYDRVLGPAEHGDLAALRARALEAARGRTLEVAAGTGHNLHHYPPGVTSLVLAEPDPHMASRLRKRLESVQSDIERIEVASASAESLPYEDSSFDSVVCTLGLCTIPDPAAALAEIRRVLVPGGSFCFLEHVRSERRGRARRQDLVTPPWRRVAGGCHPNRDTGAEIAAAGFRIDWLERGTMPRAPGFLRPMIIGVARRPGSELDG